MSEYLEKEVLPVFKQWVDSMTALIPMNEARNHGQSFVANYVDAKRVATRGAVYDFFEKLADYAEMNATMKALSGRQMTELERVQCENMHTLARGVVWAVQHDGFDHVKHLPLDMWGADIQAHRKRM